MHVIELKFLKSPPSFRFLGSISFGVQIPFQGYENHGAKSLAGEQSRCQSHDNIIKSKYTNYRATENSYMITTSELKFPENLSW